mgnify:CR=1 FL=1
MCAVEDKGSTLKLRAIVDKGGDEFGEGRRPLVCAFRQAADFGGEGALTVVGYMDFPGSFGVRATASKGASTCEELDDDEVAAVAETDAYQEADQLVAAMVAERMPAAREYAQISSFLQADGFDDIVDRQIGPGDYKVEDKIEAWGNPPLVVEVEGIRFYGSRPARLKGSA